MSYRSKQGTETEFISMSEKMMKGSILSNKGFKSSQRHHLGQSLVEFALILPLFVLIVAGIFDLGRAFFSSITITNAARTGARYGTLNPDYSQGMCQATLDEANQSGVTITNNDVSISCTSTVTCLLSGTPWAGCTNGQPLRVTVNYLYDDMVLRFFFPSGINMERYVEMLVP